MHFGTSLACQWLGLHLPVQWGTGSIPGRGAKIPHTLQCSKSKQKNQTPQVAENQTLRAYERKTVSGLTLKLRLDKEEREDWIWVKDNNRY